MARRPPQVCAQPGCPTLVEQGNRCPTHQANSQRAASRRRRAADGQQHYDTSAWQRTRSSYRRRHPTCARCASPTTDVDHVIPRRILIMAGVANPDANTWLQSLCHPCHSTKTATVDKPLLRRLDAGEDPSKLADEALKGWG